MPCENCGVPAPFLDDVDFNKSCEEERGIYLPRTGRMVDYYLCDACGFCFAPEFRTWTIEEFAEKIYNDDYIKVDPDYAFDRPNNYAKNLHLRYGPVKDRICHLDYGGGAGLLSKSLKENGWNSQSYDPMVDREKDVAELGTFNFITAIEVFEHVPDINDLADRLARLCASDGMIMFGTFCSDGHIKRGENLSWWYVAPRNGHISIFSSNSLGQMLDKRGFSFYSVTPVLHVAFRNLPDWSGYKLG